MAMVKDIMTRDVVTLSPEDEITHAAKVLLEKGINGAPVVDDSGKLVGILCQSDLISLQKRLPIPSLFTLLDGFFPLTSMKHVEREIQKISATTVVEAMTPNPLTVTPDMAVEEVATIMVEKNFHTLPVLEEGRLVGIVGKQDVLKTLIRFEGQEAPG
ncbi:MAG: CBS domain-containing protein [Deltaproteobacteria bacterium]|nr:CBS domain-containing protein [Deltaproteobacteria bacterium]MBW2018051.1 CBS domain-containing protein [Deltaproteobacteria bacterium]MBW2128974.1 CBS domain-containing protein [Deltaproteobacteria bacterium]MBW2302931.1 CBS domain-containing protein [Deltaproteobacteria bacterium]